MEISENNTFGKRLWGRQPHTPTPGSRNISLTSGHFREHNQRQGKALHQDCAHLIRSLSVSEPSPPGNEEIVQQIAALLP